MIVPMAATVAGAEPDMAPKKAQHTEVTIAKPPVKCPIQASAKSTNLLVIPPLDINAPPAMKNGIAISGKESHAVNIFWQRNEIGCVPYKIK